MSNYPTVKVDMAVQLDMHSNFRGCALEARLDKQWEELGTVNSSSTTLEAEPVYSSITRAVIDAEIAADRINIEAVMKCFNLRDTAWYRIIDRATGLFISNQGYLESFIPTCVMPPEVPIYNIRLVFIPDANTDQERIEA